MTGFACFCFKVKIVKNIKTLEKHLKSVVPQWGVVCISLYMYFFFVRYVITGQKIFFMLSFWSKCSTLVPPWPFIRHFPSHYAQVYIFIFNIFMLLSIFYYYTNFCLKYFFIYIDILIADKVVKTEMKNNTEQRLKLG